MGDMHCVVPGGGGLAVYLFQAPVNRHPLNVLVEKCIGLGLAVYWVVHATQRDM